jgi:hypothetical protein
VSSRRTQNLRKPRYAAWTALRIWLASAGIALGLATVIVGQERPPPGFVSPPPDKTAAVDANQISADDPKTERPAGAAKPRDPDFKYPPTYSSKKDRSGFSGLMNGLFGSDDDKKKAEPASEVPVRQVPPGTPPAWKWYGYGAPVPGANPLTPNGVYAPVHPEWYLQMCTTPGAIPAVLPAHTIGLPQLPPPQETGPPPMLGMPNPAPNIRSDQMIVPPAEIRDELNVRPPAEIRDELNVRPPAEIRDELNVRPAAEIRLPVPAATNEPLQRMPAAVPEKMAEIQMPKAPSPYDNLVPIATSEQPKAELQVPMPSSKVQPPPPDSTPN